MLWQDRRGRFSYLRAGTLIGLFLPALAILYFALTHNLGPRPRTEAIHEAGLWTIRFLLVTLAITPMRRIARYAFLVDVRRMIGVACCCYILLHFSIYIADEGYNLRTVASEIIAHIYLTIGFTALVGLCILAATSNDYMVRKLGGVNWRRLHWLVYPIMLLALIHYFMQSKLEVFEPTVAAGLFIWLMLYRVLHWTLPARFKSAGGEFPVWAIALIGVAAALLDFLGEAAGYWIWYSADPMVVLTADYDFSDGMRPGWYVLILTEIITLVALWRMVLLPPKPRAAKPVAANP
jgi:sulfoxide reductase heme-binding subunit YedZ